MKHFKNSKQLTVEALKEKYTNYRWGNQPRDVQYEAKNFEKLVKECEESDIYLDWQKKKKDQKVLLQELKGDLSEIQSNKMEIILRNSEEEYEKVRNQVRDMRYSAESQLNTIESNAPPSKRDILKPIYEVIDKEKKRAHENWLDWMRRQDEACSCGRGSYCQC